MVVPFITFPGLKIEELILLESVQTALNLLIFYSLLYLGLYIIHGEREKKAIKKLMITGIYIEIFNLLLAFSWYFLIFFVLVGFLYLIFFFFSLPFFIIYLMYYKKSESNELKVLFLYLISFFPAFALSSFLASTILNLIGIENYFVLTF